jgi:hypothetical protein
MNPNKLRFRPESWLKALVVKPGREPRPVQFGIYSGLVFNLDLTSEARIYVGLWERETYRFIRSALPRCRWLIDVGAGKGELCILFATQPGVKQVFVCEPQGSQADLLRANLQSNRARLKISVRVVERPIGNDGTAGMAMWIEHIMVLSKSMLTVRRWTFFAVVFLC